MFMWILCGAVQFLKVSLKFKINSVTEICWEFYKVLVFTKIGLEFVTFFNLGY